MWQNSPGIYDSFNCQKKPSSTENPLFNPWRPNPGQKEKNNLNFYFHPFLWCLKRFYEGLKGVKIKILFDFYFNITFLNIQDGKG